MLWGVHAICLQAPLESRYHKQCKSLFKDYSSLVTKEAEMIASTSGNLFLWKEQYWV
jgi:hypothetical protein